MKTKWPLVTVAIDLVIKTLMEKHYSKKSINHYGCMLRQFERYAIDHRQQYVTPRIVDSFRSYKAPFLAEHSRKWVDSTMRRMLDAIGGNYIIKRIDRPWRTTKALERELTLVDEFARRNLGWSESTRIQRLYWMRRFLASLPSCKKTPKWNSIRPVDVARFLNTLSPKAVFARIQAMRGLSAIFRVLLCMGNISTPLHTLIRIPCRFPRKPPTVWTKDDTLLLLTSIDRSRPPGRRDYAILTLACHLGLRAVDIRTLRLDSLLWENEVIDLVQKKTGRRIRLPLLPEVGSAIVDYLRHERPASDAPEVFLRFRAPFTPFCKTYNFDAMLFLRARKAGIPRTRVIGLHGFRRAVATRLLNENRPIPVIAACLGHIDMDTTRKYLSIDREMLREVGIDPEREASRA